MKKFYLLRFIAQQGNKSKVVFMTFTIMLFTIAFTQAQETDYSNRSEAVSIAKEQAYQRIDPADFSENGQPISIRNAGARNATSSIKLGDSGDTSSVTGACGKGAISTSIDQIYGNLNTYAFADDFVVNSLENFYLEEMEVIFLMDYDVTADEIFLNFYKNASGGGPGTEFPVSLTGAQVEIENLGQYGTTIKDIMVITVTFATPIVFPGGMEGASYWAATRITHNGGANSAAAIGTSTMSASQTFYVKRTTSWEKNTVAYTGVPQQDLLYGFYGQCENIPAYVYENGTWTPRDPSGFTNSNDIILVVNGTTSLTADTDVKNLHIRTGATLKINKVLNLYGDMTINGDLVFVSTATGNGELGYVSPNSTITGEATVQRYMQSKRSYRIVSSAVNTSGSIHNNWQEGATSNINNPAPGFGTHITGSTTDQQNGFDGTATGEPSMFTANIATQGFDAISNTNVNTLVAGNPYLLFVRGNRSINLSNNLAVSETVLRAKGTLRKGNQPKTYTTNQPGNFVMFGNPYQSTLDINSVFDNSYNVNLNHYYVYDPSLGDHGSYVTVVLADGTNTSESAANQYLQPGQGAQFTTLYAGQSSVTFKEGHKAPGNHTATNANGNNVTSDNMLLVQLYTQEHLNNGGPVHDSFGILFDDTFDNGITAVDALKPMNFYENFGIDHNGTYLSLEYRKMPQSPEVYPLYSDGYANSDYALKVNLNGLEDSFLYLDDQYTGTSTLLEAGETVYGFSVDAAEPNSIATDRFSIRTQERLGVNNNSMLADIRIFPNPMSDGTFYIHAPKLNGKQVEVNIADITGRQVYNDTLNCQNNRIAVSVNSGLTTGVYLVTLKFAGEESTYRLLKQ